MAKVKGLLLKTELKMAEEAKPVVHEFSEEQVDEFKDGFELFDMTGEGIIPWSQCSNVARCFGFNPMEEQVKLLLAGGDEENMPTKDDMATKSIHFDDFPASCGVSPPLQ